MVEPKLTLFKMQIKSRFRKSPELCQAHFSNAPEVFNSVNMGLAVGKFVVSMLNPRCFHVEPNDVFYNPSQPQAG